MSSSTHPVIDTHVHVWKAAAPWMSWLNDRPDSWEPVRRDFSWNDLRGQLDLAKVSNLILVQAGMTPEETRELLRLGAEQASVLGVVGWASLSSAAATERDLDSFIGLAGSEKLVGIRNNHGWEPDRNALTDTGAIDCCRLLSERKLTLDLHFADDSELPIAIDLANRVPELTVVIDHLGKPRLGDKAAFRTWCQSIHELSQLPNVYIKYSGWATFVHRTVVSDIKPYVDVVVDAFRPERIMYASNWPVALVAGSYADTYEATLGAIADLSDEQLREILFRTAARCYLTEVADAIPREIADQLSGVGPWA